MNHSCIRDSYIGPRIRHQTHQRHCLQLLWFVYMWPDAFTCDMTDSSMTLIEKNPGGGGSSLLCFLIKNPEEEDPPWSTWYKFFEGGPLPPGSWSGNIVNRKTPRGGGLFRSTYSSASCGIDTLPITSMTLSTADPVYIHVTRRIHMGHGAFTSHTQHSCVIECAMFRVNASKSHSHKTSHMGWLQLVGSIKL